MHARATVGQTHMGAVPPGQTIRVARLAAAACPATPDQLCCHSKPKFKRRPL